MCGLALAYNFDGKTPVNEKICNIYQNQRTRGTEGYGLAVLQKNDQGKEQLLIKRNTHELFTAVDLKIRENQGYLAMFHHRTPTSSDNLIEQTHPILVSNGSLKNDYLVIHNGVIINADELRKKHLELGFIYTTDYLVENYYKKEELKFNDSECLAIELARYLEGQIKTPGTIGAVAFILLVLDKTTNLPIQIGFGRNIGNPLRMGRNNNNLVIGSENIGVEVASQKMHLVTLADPKHEIQTVDFTLQTYNTTPTAWPAKNSVGFKTTDGKDYERDINYCTDNDVPMIFPAKHHTSNASITTPEEENENELAQLDSDLATTLETFWNDFTDTASEWETFQESHTLIDNLTSDLRRLLLDYQPTVTRKYYLENPEDARTNAQTLEEINEPAHHMPPAAPYAGT